MADDNYDEYVIQLQSVEAALAAEPNNEELKKLKLDLEEIISIAQDLTGSSHQPSAPQKSAQQGNAEDPISVEEEVDSDDEFTQSLSRPLKDWKAGDRCLAKMKGNGKYCEAFIKSVTGEKALLLFPGLNKTEVFKLVQLRLPDVDKKAEKDRQSRRQQFQAEKDKRKKKALRKTQKLKELDDAKEKEKNNWKSFQTKSLTKQMKGVKRESIFASPDSTVGKVGVGTCGVGGKTMTPTLEAKGYVKSLGGYH